MLLFSHELLRKSALQYAVTVMNAGFSLKTEAFYSKFVLKYQLIDRVIFLITQSLETNFSTLDMLCVLLVSKTVAMFVIVIILRRRQIIP